MKILFLHPKAWIGEYAILKKLGELGHEVCVLEERRDGSISKPLQTKDFLEPGDGIATFWYDPKRGWEKLLTWPFDRIFKKSFEGRNLAHRMWIIRRVLRHFQPDIAICTDGFTYAIPAALLRRMGLFPIPLLASYIGGDILDCASASYGKRRTPLVTWLIRQGINQADGLRAVSPLVARHLLAEGAAAKKIGICPSHLVFDQSLLDDIFTRRSEIASRVRTRYAIPPGSPLIVTLSLNNKGKGLQVLAQAWPKILQALPAARWLLCGPPDPWLEQSVWPLLRQAGVGDSVCATGSLRGAEVFEHLATADVHINPSLCEGLNMVTVEAAAVGTPTLTSDGAGIAEWIERYTAGLVVPAGDVERLADATIAALRNPAQCEIWSRNARAMSVEFGLDNVAQRLLALLPTPPN